MVQIFQLQNFNRRLPYEEIPPLGLMDWIYHRLLIQTLLKV
jgi:hypothetical protein